MSQGTFSETLVRLDAFKRISVFGPKIEFLPRGKSMLLAKKKQIFKWAFFTCLCPEGSLRVKKLLWQSFLSGKNALSKTFLFLFYPKLIFSGLFLCPWCLGRPKTCVNGHFRTD